MRTIDRVPLLAALLILSAVATSSAWADVAADAKKSERELIGLEQQYKEIVTQLRVKTKTVPPALGSGLTAVIGKSEQCLAAIAKAKAYSRKLQTGKPSNDSAKLLKQHMQQVRQKQAACNEELTRFSKVAQDYLSARR